MQDDFFIWNGTISERLLVSFVSSESTIDKYKEAVDPMAGIIIAQGYALDIQLEIVINCPLYFLKAIDLIENRARHRAVISGKRRDP